MRSISKIVVATAISAACSYASAATVTATANVLGRESADLNATPVVNTALNAAGAVRFTTSGIGTQQRFAISPVGSAAFAGASLHTQTFVCSAGTASAVFEIATGASSSTAIVYDIFSASGGSLNGASCAIPSIVFTAASMRVGGAESADIQITGAVYSTNNPTNTIDSFSAVTVASVANAFSFAVTTPFNAVIDTTKSRLTFTNSDGDWTSGSDGHRDDFVLTATKASRSDVGDATMTGASFNLTLTAAPGFQFLQEPSTTASSALNCSASTGSGQATAVATTSLTRTSAVALSPVSGACTTLTASFTGLTNGSVATVSLGRIAKDTASSVATAYTSTTFTAGYTINKAANTLTATNSSATLSAGSWTQNGATDMRLNYVPLTDNTSLQILISNTSSVAGEATFVAYSGAATCTGNLGAIAANSVTAIGSALRSALRGTPNSTTTTNCTTTFDDVSNSAAVLISTTTPGTSTIDEDLTRIGVT